MSRDHSQNHYGPNASFDGYDSDLASAGILIESLRQQLAAALAACKVKDEALEAANNGLRYWMDAFPLSVTEADNEEMLKLEEALAVQPDDSAIMAWLGEPSGWTHSCPVLCLDGVELWIDRCPHCGKPAPKGMK